MKPMLAADCEGNTALIKFPVLASPKLDGFRCVIVGGRPMTRSLKPVVNKFVQDKLTGLPEGLDGELIVGKATEHGVFGRTSSGVTAVKGQPDFRFFVFDRQPTGPGLGHPPFSQRLAWIRGNVRNWKSAFTTYVEHKLVHTEVELLEYELALLEQGYEGVMVRDPRGPYKHGRATLREGWLTKVKRFVDAEGVCVGYKELLHNENVAKINELGHTQRSSHKAGKRASSMLGAMTVQLLKDVKLPNGQVLPKGLEFDVGTGLTEAERRLLWSQQETLPGRIVKFKFFPVGIKDKPKWPVWVGFRAKEDM